MNAWQQVQWIAAESLNYMEDALIVSQLAGRDKTADFNVKPNGYAVGSIIDIVNNPVFEAKEFVSAIEIQDIRSSKRNLEIEKHFDISVQLTAKEKRLDMANFSEQIIRPALYEIAEKCDRYLATKILQGAGLYVSSSVFGSAADMAQAKKAATFQQLSSTGRFTLMDDTLEAFLLGQTFFNTHNQRGTTGERVFNEGSLGRAMGMEHYSSLNFPEESHTAGTMVAVTNNDSGANNLVGNKTLVVDTQTAGRNVQAGDRLYVAGVRRPLIVATTIADTDAATDIALVDPIAEIIPDNAAVTVIGSGTTYDIRGAIFDDNSLAVAMPVLDPPSDKPSAIMSNNGYSIRVVQGYDMVSKKDTISFDVLLGATAYDPRRITLLADSQ